MNIILALTMMAAVAGFAAAAVMMRRLTALNRDCKKERRAARDIAHDFNNVLASIIGYADFLTEDLDHASKQHQFAEKILQGGLQAQALNGRLISLLRQADGDENTVLAELQKQQTEKKS